MARRRDTSAGRAPNLASSIYKGKDGRWHGRVSMGLRDDGSPDRRHVSAATEALVIRKVRVLERERDAGQVTGAGRAPTVETWLSHWVENIAGRAVRPKTLEGYRTAVYRHAVPGIGKHRLNRLQPEHLEALYAQLADGGLSAGSVHLVHRVLRAALNEAVARDRLGRNPALRAKPPRVTETEIVPLGRGEIQALLVAARGGWNEARYTVAIALGLRQGEALGLRWADVDLDRGLLVIRRQLQRRRWEHGCGGDCRRKRGADCPDRTGGGMAFTEPKSRSGRREIALPHALVALLRQHGVQQAQRRLVAGDLWEDHDMVFSQPTGRPIDPKRDWEDWKALLKAAGVRDARLHDARHTAATLLLVEGVDQRTVMDIMGWSQLSMTMRYQHVVPELRREAADRVGAALWPTETQTETTPHRERSAGRRLSR